MVLAPLPPLRAIPPQGVGCPCFRADRNLESLIERVASRASSLVHETVESNVHRENRCERNDEHGRDQCDATLLRRLEAGGMRLGAANNKLRARYRSGSSA